MPGAGQGRGPHRCGRSPANRGRKRKRTGRQDRPAGTATWDNCSNQLQKLGMTSKRGDFLHQRQPGPQRTAAWIQNFSRAPGRSAAVRRRHFTKAGLRVPMIARWPGRFPPARPAISPGRPGLLPTAAGHCADSNRRMNVTGISVCRRCLAKPRPTGTKTFQWELKTGRQLCGTPCRQGDLGGRPAERPTRRRSYYNLKSDSRAKRYKRGGQNPDVIKKFERLLKNQ